MIELKNSQTRVNLMRAFAGECQAQNRYLIAADTAQQQNFAAIAKLFRFTAEQERQHAKVFFGLMSELSGTNIEIEAGFPADVSGDIQQLLDFAAKGEASEAGVIYPDFARIAREEGFTDIAEKFSLAAAVEEEHHKRFEYYAQLMRSGMLLRSESTEERWICLNCGHIHTGSEPPEHCPFCGTDNGWAVREAEADFTK